jgi:hypothetical protein
MPRQMSAVAPKMKPAKRPAVDLSTKNSLTKYIVDNAEQLNALEGSKSKDDLKRFVNRAKEQGYQVSDSTLTGINDKIDSSPSFTNAYRYIYNMMLKGSGLGVVESKTVKKSELKKMIKEVILEMYGDNLKK